MGCPFGASAVGSSVGGGRVGGGTVVGGSVGNGCVDVGGIALVCVGSTTGEGVTATVGIPNVGDAVDTPGLVGNTV